MIIGLDCGRSRVKAVTANKILSFPAILGEWRERRLINSHGDDMEVEFRGERYFAGTLAENESEFYRSMMTDTKAHNDFLILSLLGMVRANVGASVNVVTGVPVGQHIEEEKEAIKSLLKGYHRIAVNGKQHAIHVKNVEVAVEGGAAFWSQPTDGLVHVIDSGSKTVNYVTMKNRRYIDRDSGTLPFGCDTNKSNDVGQLANRIVGEVSKKWSKDETIYLTGGKADELLPYIARYFPNTFVINNPLYANARGYYTIGKALINA